MTRTQGPKGIVTQNQRAWDERARQGERFTRPATDEELKAPLGRVDPRGWLGNVLGRRVLCLGAGGGKHSALYAAAGAIVTVVDISLEMLKLDQAMAERTGRPVRTLLASIDDLSQLTTAEFDFVVQPVSTCYVPNLSAVYREVARVLRHDGIYVSQHKTPTSLQTSVKPTAQGYVLETPYYRGDIDPLPNVSGSRHREDGTLEFLHRWEQLIGGLCKAGFVVEDLVEPRHGNRQAPLGSFEHRSYFVAPYVRLKARRVADAIASLITL